MSVLCQFIELRMVLQQNSMELWTCAMKLDTNENGNGLAMFMLCKLMKLGMFMLESVCYCGFLCYEC